MELRVASWKRISRHRVFQKGASLLRAKSGDNMGTLSTAGRPPDRPGRVEGTLLERWAGSRESRRFSWVGGPFF